MQQTALNLINSIRYPGKWKSIIIFKTLNFSSMVQTDISQLSSETAEWRQILRNYREEFAESKNLLQGKCKQDFPKDKLKEVEHFHNQFHIQLINIHDLKQEIKNHERKIQLEKAMSDTLAEYTYAEHERLLNEFVQLENTLQDLREDFKNFISSLDC